MISTTRTALACASALLAWSWAAPAAAANRVFEQCDGRKAPGSRDGGMADPVSATMPGEAPVIVADRVQGGGDLVEACTRALADPRLLADMGLRRAHLLRARALARLATDDADGAIADVDAAGTATVSLAHDPLFARSMGLSLGLVRAAALDLKGEHDQADAFAASVAKERPYSVAIQAAAVLVRRHARDAAGRDTEELYAGIVPLDPAARQAQFGADMGAGRFAAALRLYPRLAPPDAPTGPLALYDMSAWLAPLSNGLNAAYAEAATGHPDRARTLLAAMRERAAKAFAPPAAAPATPQEKTDAMRAALAGRFAGPVNAAIEQTGTMIGARASIAEGHSVDALKALVGTQLPTSAVALDLVTALHAALPAGERALAPDPTVIAAKLADARRAEKLDVALLRRAMPAPETEHSLAGYGKASSGFLSGLLPVVFSPDGFTSQTDPATGATRVEFTGRASSAPVVDELTLLRAADLARAAGRHGVVIVARSDFARTMNTYSGYGHRLVASSPAGFKTALTVRFVDPAALPADLAEERGRVLDADRLYAALAPVYIRK